MDVNAPVGQPHRVGATFVWGKGILHETTTNTTTTTTTSSGETPTDAGLVSVVLGKDHIADQAASLAHIELGREMAVFRKLVLAEAELLVLFAGVGGDVGVGVGAPEVDEALDVEADVAVDALAVGARAVDVADLLAHGIDAHRAGAAAGVKLGVLRVRAVVQVAPGQAQALAGLELALNVARRQRKVLGGVAGRRGVGRLVGLVAGETHAEAVRHHVAVGLANAGARIWPAEHIRNHAAVGPGGIHRHVKGGNGLVRHAGQRLVVLGLRLAPKGHACPCRRRQVALVAPVHEISS